MSDISPLFKSNISHGSSAAISSGPSTLLSTQTSAQVTLSIKAQQFFHDTSKKKQIEDKSAWYQHSQQELSPVFGEAFKANKNPAIPFTKWVAEPYTKRCRLLVQCGEQLVPNPGSLPSKALTSKNAELSTISKYHQAIKHYNDAKNAPDAKTAAEAKSAAYTAFFNISKDLRGCDDPHMAPYWQWSIFHMGLLQLNSFSWGYIIAGNGGDTLAFKRFLSIAKELPEAALMIALMYEFGIGTGQNQLAADKWCKSAMQPNKTLSKL